MSWRILPLAWCGSLEKRCQLIFVLVTCPWLKITRSIASSHRFALYYDDTDLHNIRISYHSDEFCLVNIQPCRSAHRSPKEPGFDNYTLFKCLQL
ncbi:hypothetical protein TNCV_1641631 [Trichonephila clavipes]|nr:hypothetical protein TNCV_1641631 [Trichonephila clavipes]